MRGHTTGAVLERRSTGRSEVRFNKPGFTSVAPATGNEVALDSIHGDDVFARIEAIKKVWSQGAGNSIELARVVWDARRQLLHGQWEHVLKSLPFSKRKANMLVTIGKELGWAIGQIFAQLPVGWSILYQLAQLSRAVFERMVKEGAIHPKLTLREAKELLARFKGRPSPRHSPKGGVKYRLQQFRIYVRRTLSQWKPEERAAARTELTRLLELVKGSEDTDINGALTQVQELRDTPRPRLSHPRS